MPIYYKQTDHGIEIELSPNASYSEISKVLLEILPTGKCPKTSPFPGQAITGLNLFGSYELQEGASKSFLKLLLFSALDKYQGLKAINLSATGFDQHDVYQLFSHLNGHTGSQDEKGLGPNTVLETINLQHNKIHSDRRWLQEAQDWLKIKAKAGKVRLELSKNPLGLSGSLDHKTIGRSYADLVLTNAIGFLDLSYCSMSTSFTALAARFAECAKSETPEDDEETDLISNSDSEVGLIPITAKEKTEIRLIGQQITMTHIETFLNCQDAFPFTVKFDLPATKEAIDKWWQFYQIQGDEQPEQVATYCLVHEAVQLRDAIIEKLYPRNKKFVALEKYEELFKDAGHPTLMFAVLKNMLGEMQTVKWDQEELVAKTQELLNKFKYLQQYPAFKKLIPMAASKEREEPAQTCGTAARVAARETAVSPLRQGIVF